MINPLWILLLAAVLGLLLLLFKDRQKASRAGDHVFETTQRLISVPEHCVNCLHPHATVAIRVMPHIPPGYGPIVPLLDPRFRTRFLFRYCDRCAASIRTQRLYGVIVLAAVFTIIAVTVVAALVLTVFFPKGHRAPDFLWVTAYAGLAIGTVIGLPAAFVGQRLHRYAPGISIVNDGGGTIVFHFASRVYRDHFAAMNEGASERPA